MVDNSDNSWTAVRHTVGSVEVCLTRAWAIKSDLIAFSFSLFTMTCVAVLGLFRIVSLTLSSLSSQLSTILWNPEAVEGG